jgi:hypothetical protein
MEHSVDDEEDEDEEWAGICASVEDDDDGDDHYPDASSDEKREDEDKIDERPTCGVTEQFEDCSSPILHCDVRGTNSVDRLPVRVLIDSGSTLDLVSGKMARRLERLGHKTHSCEQGIKIKVANGNKNVLNRAMKLELIVEGEHTMPTDWLVLEDLPFDMILAVLR